MLKRCLSQWGASEARALFSTLPKVHDKCKVATGVLSQNINQTEVFMFTIIIDAKKVRNSPIILNGGKKSVTELPLKLRKDVMKMLYILRNHHIPEVSFDGKATHFKTKFFVDYLHDFPFLRFWRLCMETTQLLDWYLEPHFHTSGDEILCCTCGKAQIVKHLGEQCQSIPCPSHEKWEMIDEVYMTPAKRLEKAFRNGAIVS
ncbi:MAG: hypothetical protein WC791_03690 [Candidatus Paceibacterota bacterium]